MRRPGPPYYSGFVWHSLPSGIFPVHCSLPCIQILSRTIGHHATRTAGIFIPLTKRTPEKRSLFTALGRCERLVRTQANCTQAYSPVPSTPKKEKIYCIQLSEIKRNGCISNHETPATVGSRRFLSASTTHTLSVFYAPTKTAIKFLVPTTHARRRYLTQYTRTQDSPYKRAGSASYCLT